MRKPRRFYERSEQEQRWFTEETWCKACQKPDLGLTDPQEYEDDGEAFIEGKCKICGGHVVSMILEEKKM